jgi:hypothetical protein
MDRIIKNTSFDNLDSYKTPKSDSTIVSGVVQTSSDPNSLAFQIQNQQLITYKTTIHVEKNIVQSVKVYPIKP